MVHDDKRDIDRPEWSVVSPTHRTLEQEASFLVSAAATAGLALRTVGGVGVFQQLDEPLREVFERTRECPHDIDLLTRPKTSEDVSRHFGSLGYVADERLIAWHGHARHRYFHLDDQGRPLVEVDVFLGKPPLCHPIDFMGELDRPGPAMPPTDLLLQKIQIHESNLKDAIDAALLLAEHPLAEGEAGLNTIDAPRIADLLARDWGFHHSATKNLEAMPALAADVLPADIAARAAERAAELRAVVDDTPKTRRWKLRAKVGERAQWYEDVEEVLR